MVRKGQKSLFEHSTRPPFEVYKPFEVLKVDAYLTPGLFKDLLKEQF